MKRRKFLKAAGYTFSGIAITSPLTGLASGTLKSSGITERGDKYFLGDLHNHCNLTYGHGDPRDAFEAAKEQLDFVSVTPHALWPDIPGRDDPELAWVIDYHTGAFERLRKTGWNQYISLMKEYNRPGQFEVFNSYECHSMKNGDHVVLNYDIDAAITECTSIEDLKKKLSGQKAFVTPHHMGYQDGYRGYVWDHFETESTPFVEIFSRHGLAETDQGDYSYLHDMGPRRWEGSVMYGLLKGHKFGIMGSTDQHAGYPGSYGDGRIVIMAPSLSRDNIWNALKNRKMYCVTGDKILLDFRVNDAPMGSVIRSDDRKIYINVQAGDAIDYVDIIKNGRRVGHIHADFLPVIPPDDIIRAKIKVECGWGTAPVEWNGRIGITEGIINDVSPCFRGSPYTSPQKGQEYTFRTKVNRILSRSDREVVVNLFTTPNPNVLTPQTQAVILDVTVPRTAVLEADFNNIQNRLTIEEICQGTRSFFQRGWLTEAVQIHRAIPQSASTVEHLMEDSGPEKDTDFYYIRVRLKNNQWAFSTPIWAERA